MSEIIEKTYNFLDILDNEYDSIKEMHDDIIHAMDEDRQNDTKYHFPYPESELDESKAVPIKGDATEVVNRGIEKPKSNENTSKDVSKKREKNNSSKVVIIVILVILLGMLITLLVVNNQNKTKVVEVPEVSDKTTEEAIEMLTKKGFKYDVEYEESNVVEEGYVIATKPKAGSSKKKGSIIVILESSGMADVILKDYTNQKVEALEKKLKDLGLDVKVEKKEVENPKDYIGKTGVVIDQSPKYNAEEEVELEAGTEIILYVPDIFEDYPDMIGEGWTIAKAEEFANDYGLVMNVKDKNGNNITDYSNYLNEVEKYLLDHFPFRDSFRSLKANFNYHILNKLDSIDKDWESLKGIVGEVSVGQVLDLVTLASGEQDNWKVGKLENKDYLNTVLNIQVKEVLGWTKKGTTAKTVVADVTDGRVFEDYFDDFYDIEAAEDVLMPKYKPGMKPTLIPTGLKAYCQPDECYFLLNRVKFRC